MPADGPQTRAALAALDSPLADTAGRLGIVLAAGHGKRIRSDTSKMLHQIWGRPTVERVADAVSGGLGSPDQVIVVGIKAAEVAATLGARPGRRFAYQENPVLGLPAGTGDAVRVALERFAPPVGDADRHIYIFPGDMGLLTDHVVSEFRRAFEAQPCDMMILTGGYEGPAEQNSYGRIVRVPELDTEGRPADDDAGSVIAIKEHKDILGLPADGGEELTYRGRRYAFTRRELLETREINTLVVAFHESALREHIGAMDTDNAQGELMLTDLVEILNRRGGLVRAVAAADEEEILGFNVKSVWRQMAAIARRRIYRKLMDIVTIEDEEDFYIADEVVAQILALDKDRGPLDIVIGKGVEIGPGVRLEPRVQLGDRCHLTGNVQLGEGVEIGLGVRLSTYPEQRMVLADGVQVLARSVLKGDLTIDAGSRIESGVIMTGSDEHPMRVGRGVTVKGTTYLYGCRVDDGVLIEHSVIKCRHVQRRLRADGGVQPVRYVLPRPEGLDSIAELD